MTKLLFNVLRLHNYNKVANRKILNILINLPNSMLEYAHLKKNLSVFLATNIL